MTVSIYAGTVTVRVRHPHAWGKARASIQRRVYSPKRRLLNVLNAPHAAMEHEKAGPWTIVEG